MSKNVKFDLDNKNIMKKLNKLAKEKAASIQKERNYQSRINEASPSFTDPNSSITYKRGIDLD